MKIILFVSIKKVCESSVLFRGKGLTDTVTSFVITHVEENKDSLEYYIIYREKLKNYMG